MAKHNCMQKRNSVPLATTSKGSVEKLSGTHRVSQTWCRIYFLRINHVLHLLSMGAVHSSWKGRKYFILEEISPAIALGSWKSQWGSESQGFLRNHHGSNWWHHWKQAWHWCTKPHTAIRCTGEMIYDHMYSIQNSLRARRKHPETLSHFYCEIGSIASQEMM